jgi:hypothetical protein
MSGVYLQADDQEGNFQDHGDDGLYFDDRENRTVKFVDIAWVKRWVDHQGELCVDMKNMDENDGRNQEDVDAEVSEYWRVTQEVETWDSWSCIAMDSARRRIDYWRDVCENWPPSRDAVAIV